MRFAGDKGNIDLIERHPFGAHIENSVFGGIWVFEEFANPDTIPRTPRLSPEDKGRRDSLRLQLREVALCTDAERSASLAAGDWGVDEIQRPCTITFGEHTCSNAADFPPVAGDVASEEIAQVTELRFAWIARLGRATDPFFIGRGRNLDHPRRASAPHCCRSLKHRFRISPASNRERALGLGGGDRWQCVNQLFG